MEWYDDYNVNIEAIDNQHKELVAIVTRLQEALSTESLGAETANALKFLVEYSQRHFGDEEEIMASIAYEGLENHKQLHAKLIEEIKGHLIALKKGKSINPYDLIDFLTDWLINHIRQEDKKIGRAMEKFQQENPDWDGTLS